MELEKALSQISEIHAQVLRTEVFRGYRAVTMLGTAGIALLAAALQPLLVRESPESFVTYWVIVAAVCGGWCGIDLFRRTLRYASRRQQHRTVLVVAQSLPAFLVGAVITGVLVQRDAAAIALLPGLWTLTYALGIWAGRPCLPKAVGAVAIYYVLAGTWQLVRIDAAMPSPWGMGLTFGIGQAALAGVLYLNIERSGPLQLGGDSRRGGDGQA